MERSIRYHKREYEKTVAAIKEGSARDVNNNRAAMAEAVA